jgi:hypothetical protein
MVHVALSQRSHGDEVKDRWVDATGCIELFYPNFTVFIVLGHKGGFVINFPINRITRAGGEECIQPFHSHLLAIVSF